MLMNTDEQPEATSFIEYVESYPVVITKNISESKKFYQRWLDLEIVFEATWFVFLQSKGDNRISFTLIDENHPSDPPSYGAFDGKGCFLTLQVKDAAKVYHKLRTMHAPITYELKKEDWGQLRFGLTDPNGLYIDIVQQVDPVPGYWDRYSVSK